MSDVPNSSPSNSAAAFEVASEEIGAAVAATEAPGGPDRLPKKQIVLALLAQLTLYIAFVAPSSFSLAVRIQALAPDARNTALAFAIGIPCTIVIFLTPLVGVLSDRTRSKLGRRRPWLLLGVLTGMVGAAIIGFLPNLGALITGWTIAYIGYTITAVMILAFFGDRLPENQRGRVAGINGTLTYIGPIVGITLASQLTEMPALMFLIPGVLALLGGLVFVVTMKDVPVTTPRSAVRASEIFQGFWFNPRKYSNLGWVWLSKALVFLSLAFTSIYGVYLLTSRVQLSAAEVGGIVALAGTAGVGVSILGALGSGWLSDKLGTRKPFLWTSAIVIGIAAVVTGTSTGVPQYILGGIILSFAVGVYGAVDQAVQLDVLPQEEDQNGRFLSTLGLANQIPQAVGPFLAGAIIAVAAGNYSSVYYVAGASAVLGGLAILPISLGKRANESTTSIKTPS